MSRTRLTLRRTAFVALYLVFLIVLLTTTGELFLRLFSRQSIYPSIFVEDRNVVYKYKANARGYIKTEEFYFTIHTNSLGFRDRELSVEKPSGTFRVLLLGDSFTNGVGVEIEDTYARLLESKANRGKKNRYQFINFGVGGYGTVNEFSAYINYGRQLSPDLVLLAFNRNDFRDNVVSPLRCESVGEVTMCRVLWITKVESTRRYTRFIPLYDYLAQRSYVLNLIRQRLMGYLYVADQTEQKKVIGNEDDVERSIEMTEQLILGLNREVKRDRVGFVIVLLPHKEDYVYDGPSGIARGRITAVRQDSYYKSMNRICGQADIRCINLVDEFAALQVPMENLFFGKDAHYNVSGHRYIADAIYDKLQTWID